MNESMNPPVYYTLLTAAGKACLAEALAHDTKVKFKTMALGDGNGTLPKPTGNESCLVHEVWRGMVNVVALHETLPGHISVDCEIPSEKGGFTIREVGLYDDSDVLVAVGNFPPTVKPEWNDGSTRKMIVRVVLVVENTNAVFQGGEPPSYMTKDEVIEQIAEAMEKCVQGIDVGEVKTLAPGEPVSVTIDKKDPTKPKINFSIPKGEPGSGGGAGGGTYTVNGAAADESGNFNITPELIGAAAVQHTHEITDVDGVEETLAGKADSVHSHPAVASISVNGGTPLTQAVTLKGGTNISITQIGNLFTFNQLLPPFSNAEAIHSSNGAVPYKLFIGTASEWSAFVKVEGENYLVIII